MASENSGGGKSKTTNTNIKESRISTSSSKTTSANIKEDRVPSKTTTPPIKVNNKSIYNDSPAAGLAMVDLIKNTYTAEYNNPINDEIIKVVPPAFFITASIQPTPSTPTVPVTISLPPPPIKTAPIDTILFNDNSLPVEVMADLIFENIGGQELLSITRSDIVNGQKISYQPIKNLSAIQQQYNPNNILGLQQTDNKYFAGFPIKLENKIPEEGNGPDGNNVYLNEFGDLVIEFVNLSNDEQVETQISINGTIYEADFGDYIS